MLSIGMGGWLAPEYALKWKWSPVGSIRAKAKASGERLFLIFEAAELASSGYQLIDGKRLEDLARVLSALNSSIPDSTK